MALAAAAGGLQTLGAVLAVLPDDFPAAVVIVQHLHPRHRSLIASILSRRISLSVREAEEGARLEAGEVFIAPPDHHLLVNPDGILSLSRSERVHFVRPSADLLFASMAASYRDRSVAVVLTGTGSDGETGVRAVKKMGGTVIVQDKASADFFGMPDSAIRTGCVNFVLGLEKLPAALMQLVSEGTIR